MVSLHSTPIGLGKAKTFQSLDRKADPRIGFKALSVYACKPSRLYIIS